MCCRKQPSKGREQNRGINWLVKGCRDSSALGAGPNIRITKSRDQHNGLIVATLPQHFKEHEPVDTRHIDVKYPDIWRDIVPAQQFLGRAKCRDIHALQRQIGVKRIADSIIIVKDID